jgi:4-amino-4-deoxy-L-arabinose transferase-like glycosyltransferase
MSGASAVRAEMKLAAILLIAALLLGICLRLTNPSVIARSPDEKIYAGYVASIAQDPVDAPKQLVQHYNTTPGSWIYPIPLRVGYFYLVWAMMELRHLTPVQAGVAVSTGTSILQLLMVAVIGWRFFGRLATVVAVTLLSVCPADLTMARRVWCDEPVAAVGLVFLWLCAELASKRRGWPWFAALWICGGAMVLIKETAGVFYGFCIAGLMIQTWRSYRDWTRLGWIAMGAVATAFMSFAIMACLCGGVPAALDIIRHNAQAEPGNVYQNKCMTGPWYAIPLGLWIVSPFTGTVCAVAFAALILRKNSLGDILKLDQRQRDFTWGLAGLITAVIVAISIPRNLMDLRYVSFIFGPRYLMAGLGVTYLATRLREAGGKRAARWVTTGVTVVVLASCWVDYATYRRVDVRQDLNDLDIYHVVTGPLGRRM